MKKRITIGFAGVADYRNSIAQNILAGIHDAVKLRDCNLINFFSAKNFSLSDDIELYNHYPSKFALMNSYNLDGLITWASSFLPFMTDTEISAAHKRIEPLPMVSLGVPLLDGVPGVFTRSSDDIPKVLHHLVYERGYTRIAFLGSLSRIQYKDRLQAYRNWLLEQRLPCDESLVFLSDAFEAPDIKALVDDFVERGANRAPLNAQAIITVSDIIGSQIIDELISRGIRVPEDVAVTGFNNQLESTNAIVPLTTIDPRFYERAFHSVDLLIEAIEKAKSGKKIKSVYFESRLVVRQSSGSFEELIIKTAMIPSRKELLEGMHSEVHGDLELRAALQESLNLYCTNFNSPDIDVLIGAIIADYRGRSHTSLLSTLRAVIQNAPEQYPERFAPWQMLLSVSRTVVLGFCAQDTAKAQRMENLFHQARIMLSILSDYRNLSRNHDTYRFNTVAHIAMDFASATSGMQVLRMICSHMAELEMPSIFMVLQDNMSSLPENGRLALVYPPILEPEYDDGLLGLPIPTERLRFERWLPDNKRYTLMLETLYHQGKYMGFALIEVGTANMALYEMFRMLLSRTLYGNYLREYKYLKDGEIPLLLRNSNTDEHFKPDENVSSLSGGLNSARIMKWLSDHLHEATNIDRMASDLGVSRSHLMHRARQLTGHSIQVLHELLKMERARVLLEMPDIKVSDVAARLGFQSAGYFSKVFKKHSGMSPAAWQQRK